MEKVDVNIFAYSDFREYARDYYEARHKADRKFSHRFIAQKLGDKSPSFLQKVIENTRRLNPHQIETLIRLFMLEDFEAKYFRVLYLYSTAPSRLERELYLEQLISLNHTPRRELAHDLYEYYRHWYNPAIRSILSVADIGDDMRLLASTVRPHITSQQAKESIALLNKLGLIKKDDAGFWKPANEGLFVKDTFHQEAIQSYRHQCLDLASEAIEQGRNNPDYHFSTGTMSISEDAHRRILDKLDKFRAEVRSIVRKDPLTATKVIQLQIQAFPLMEKMQ